MRNGRRKKLADATNKRRIWFQGVIKLNRDGSFAWTATFAAIAAIPVAVAAIHVAVASIPVAVAAIPVAAVAAVIGVVY